MPFAAVYVNHGRVIADCPMDCGNAYRVNPGQTTLICSTTGTGCKTMSQLVWPGDFQAIMDELGKRPIMKTRNWIPSGHPLAGPGVPVDQTPAELAEEFAQFGG